MSAERDSHFAGFAKLLISDLNTLGFDEDGYRSGEETQKIIARRAYDFACHIMKNRFPAYPGVHNIVEAVSDLTKWPE